MVQDVDIAQKLWGEEISALKGKNTRSKPNIVASNQVKTPMELMKLQNEVLLT